MLFWRAMVQSSQPPKLTEPVLSFIDALAEVVAVAVVEEHKIRKTAANKESVSSNPKHLTRKSPLKIK